MKNIVKSLMVVGAMAAAGVANADWCDCIQPVIGADYYQAWMKGKGSYNQVYPKSYPGATIYVATKFSECFGLELGYDWSARKSKNFTFGTGTSFFGNTITDSGVTGNTKLRRTGGHLDLVGFIPLCDCWELFGSLGYGWVQTKVTTTITSVGPSTTSANLSSALLSVSGKGRSVFRVGVGALYMVTDCVGLRAKLGWESTSSLRVDGNTAFNNLGFNNKAYKGSATVAAGAFVKF